MKLFSHLTKILAIAGDVMRHRLQFTTLQTIAQNGLLFGYLGVGWVSAILSAILTVGVLAIA